MSASEAARSGDEEQMTDFEGTDSPLDMNEINAAARDLTPDFSRFMGHANDPVVDLTADSVIDLTAGYVIDLTADSVIDLTRSSSPEVGSSNDPNLQKIVYHAPRRGPIWSIELLLSIPLPPKKRL
jgi:hypothetical protein